MGRHSAIYSCIKHLLIVYDVLCQALGNNKVSKIDMGPALMEITA